MASNFPGGLDNLNRPDLTHGDVADALTAVETAVAGLLQAGGSTGARFLSGNRPPISGSGLYPLDGVNDPWRWFPPMTGWVGPAYEVTWHAGDVTGFLPPISDTNQEYALWIGSVTTPTEANNNPGQFIGTNVDGSPGVPVSNAYVGQSGNIELIPIATDAPLVAIEDGSGIAFLFQAERDWTGPTAVPDPAWSAGLANLRTVLGSDIVVGDPFTFNEAGDGQDDDFWFDKSETMLYGPKTGGVWPAGVNIKGFDSNAAHFLHAGLNLGPTTFAGEPALTIADSGPADASGYLSPGQLAVWYDATTGAPTVRFTGIDNGGTVYVASLPMTPAPAAPA